MKRKELVSKKLPETPPVYRIKPYARLLTMLGEQLIKNERIALVELMKNSYDADASWVKITFEGFDDYLGFDEKSKIIIEDDGVGMSMDVVKNHWLNPATPIKKNLKFIQPKTRKGRVIQGDKGIGRFAILKLGRKIKVITRAKNTDREIVVGYDFSKYDDDFLTESGKKKVLFLEDLSVSISTRVPRCLIKQPVKLSTRSQQRKPYGTRIEISNLKGN